MYVIETSSASISGTVVNIFGGGCLHTNLPIVQCDTLESTLDVIQDNNGVIFLGNICRDNLIADYVLSTRKPNKYYVEVDSIPSIRITGYGGKIFKHVNLDEERYLKYLKKVTTRGILSITRGHPCFQLIGKSFKYNIRNYRLPLFTHRKIFFRGIVEELLFFISGKTDTKILESKNVNIWKKHTSKEWLKSRNLEYPEGCYGPTYGFQLRHWGAEWDYVSHSDQYDDIIVGGIDQLTSVITELKTNPTSRRILFSYWNPSILEKAALPPCHLLYQFHAEHIDNKWFLSCTFYQRSNDFALAGCFNVVSASILTMMVCKVCGMEPKKVVHMIGNLHVYQNQIEAINGFLNNNPKCFPYVKIPVKQSVDEYSYDDFQLLNYKPYQGLHRIPMSS